MGGVLSLFAGGGGGKSEKLLDAQLAQLQRQEADAKAREAEEKKKEAARQQAITAGGSMARLFLSEGRESGLRKTLG